VAEIFNVCLISCRLGLCVMRVGIYPENALIIALAALAGTLLSAVYPAWQAGRVAPAETIRVV
jgi:ABC-type lipoprotein release transport system permease subunit